MQGQIPLSFEFFPPKSATAKNKLEETCRQLAQLNPEFFSVTFGAGGSTRSLTADTVASITQATTCEVAPHLSCISSTRNDLLDILETYKANDIKRIVVLRGDIPSGHVSTGGDFRYASELVAFIREQAGEHFFIEVAAYPEFHPETKDYQQGIENFKRKMDAGADRAITQYFYNSDAYFYFVENARKLGVEKPIVPGIMPITNFHGLRRFSKMCEAEIPRWLYKRLEVHADDEQAIAEIGLDFMSRFCERLIQSGAPALHFYTLNKAEPSLAILKNIRTANSVSDNG